MITAVDTNVLIDVFSGSLKFGPSSAEMLRSVISDGAVVACDVVWTEAGAMFDRDAQFIEAMQSLGVAYSPTQQNTALFAARAWHTYRSRGGRRQRVAADFLIGAHAMEQADRLLTRDRGFYRDYFGKLRVIDPTP